MENWIIIEENYSMGFTYLIIHLYITYEAHC